MDKYELYDRIDSDDSMSDEEKREAYFKAIAEHEEYEYRLE